MDGQFVILAQEPTRIPGIPIMPTFIRHKKGRDPRWEAKMLARYFYEKSEAGKISFKTLKSDEVMA